MVKKCLIVNCWHVKQFLYVLVFLMFYSFWVISKFKQKACFKSPFQIILFLVILLFWHPFVYPVSRMLYHWAPRVLFYCLQYP